MSLYDRYGMGAFKLLGSLILALALAFMPGLAFANEVVGEFAEDVAAATLVEDAADAGSGVAEEETGDEAEVESAGPAEVAADAAVSDELAADEAAGDDVDAAVVDEVAAEVAEDAAVEEAALADEAAPTETAPAEAPMTLMAKSSAAASQGHWEVTASRGHGLQRYWIEADGSVAKNRLIDPAEGSGWWAYARPEGYVVRGKYTAKDGKVYLANNDGKLENPGWLVTKAYDGGMQRYWIDAEAHAAVPGYSSDGWDHYTRPEGYVSRGKYVAKNGYVYLANNDGKLENPGWVVTNKYDGGMQRYRIDSKAHAAIPGYSAEGWAHYTLPAKGYVARGAFTDSNGRKMTADNDGRVRGGLPKPRNGWIVSSDFGHGLQRYWFRNDVMAKSELLNVAETGWWAYARPEGYVVRGKYAAKDGKVYLANNDGKLENPGWVVTKVYDGGYQRYWIDEEAHAAVPGHAVVAGEHYYSRPSVGYVLRGKLRMGGGMLLADNDGKLAWQEGWLVTNKFDGGLQRYRIDGAPGSGLMGAHLGQFSLGGASYYGRPDQGYVVRGVWTAPGGRLWLANNEGKLVLPETIVAMMAKCPQANGLQLFGGSWSINQAALNQFTAAIRRFTSAGQGASVVMLDLMTGFGFSYDAVASRYAASTIKGPYLTFLCEEFLDKGRVSHADVDYLMTETAVWSWDATYKELVGRYGFDNFNAWLRSNGASTFGGGFPWTNTRDLALAWANNARYELGSGANASWNRALLGRGNNSQLQAALGASNTITSKPGWYPPGSEGLAAYNDAGLVIGRDGRAYVVAVMTNCNCEVDQSKMQELIRAIDNIHDKMPR